MLWGNIKLLQGNEKVNEKSNFSLTFYELWKKIIKMIEIIKMNDKILISFIHSFIVRALCVNLLVRKWYIDEYTFL